MDPLFWRAEAGFDWARYVQEHGGVRSIRSKPGEYMLVCPDCQKPKLAVNTDKRAWRCFTCSEGGRDGASLVAKVEQLPWGESLIRVLEGHKQLIGRVDKIESELAEAVKPDRRTFQPVPWPEGFRFLAGSEPLATCREMVQAAAYCNDRGIPVYVVQEMRLGVCVTGPFRNRLIFPCFDSGGRLLFYQGRAMWKPQPRELRHIKVLSPRSEDGCAGPGDCLLNLSYCAERMTMFQDRVLLVEGPVDCAHAWPDAVASWGKKISAKQMELLVRAGVRGLDLCWDPDAVAEMMRIAPILADLFDVRIVHLPTGHDPGDMSKEDIEACRVRAVAVGSGDRFSYLP